ncbi:hypothetical protein, partial [Staphylococcus capitis]|uniref:hypothetical protein n=1 Tax=Staphylococcus capitis TaxID=29388 RepID=UPI0011A46D0F
MVGIVFNYGVVVVVVVIYVGFDESLIENDGELNDDIVCCFVCSGRQLKVFCFEVMRGSKR